MPQPPGNGDESATPIRGGPKSARPGEAVFFGEASNYDPARPEHPNADETVEDRPRTSVGTVPWPRNGSPDPAVGRRRGCERFPIRKRSEEGWFPRDIRPILADKCFKCHGPDIKQRKGKLRLDNRRDATIPAESGGPAIVPGNFDESELYHRITSDDPEERMPPAKTGKPLTPAEIARLKTWIEQGAEYQGHWAFVPPVRPELPAVKDCRLVPQPDRLASSSPGSRPRASRPRPRPTRSRSIRRLSLDLIGLPPSVEDVDAFVADTRDDAYARLVNRLLDSPQYGERWGRIWLDAARYADSDGYEKDKSRQVFAYRDWVIHALNRDLPYSQFIIDQIAGDLLPGAEPGPGRRHRLPAQFDDQRGRGRRSRAVPHGGHVRPDGLHRQGDPGPDHPVRPVPYVTSTTP